MRAISIVGLAICACASPAEAPLDRCLDGTIATVDGCRPLPDWEARRRDAGEADRELSTAMDAGTSTAGLDAGLADANAQDAGDEGIDTSGAWALRTIDRQYVQNEFVERELVTITSLVRMDVLADTDPPAVVFSLCSLRATAFAGSITHYPAPAARSARSQGSLLFDGPLEVGAAVDARMVRVMGYMDNGAPFPTEATDPRIMDTDEDDHPGVTLRITGQYEGALYVALRDESALEGRVVSADRIEGASYLTRARLKLGASNQVLLLGETRSTPAEDVQSTFAMVRVERELSCARLEADEDTYF